MDTQQTLLVIVLVVLGIGLVVGIIVAVLRARYIRSLRDKGWQFVNSPTLDIVDGFTVPPFGLDFARKTDEQVIGSTHGGVPFQVFDYDGRGHFRLAAMPLPFPLPEFVAGVRPRDGVRATALGNHDGLEVFADNVTYAERLLPMLSGPLSAFAARYAVDLSVDGSNLVMIGAPTKADELEAFLEAMAPVAQAFDASALQDFQTPPPPRGFVFYRHPGWTFHGDDDTFLERVQHTTGGFGHTATQVVTGEEYGLSFIGLQHHWKTTRTEHYTDSEGRSHTRTVTDHHSENILETYLPFSLPYLSVGPDAFGPGWFARGQLVEFEGEAFNKDFDVRADNPKFASDVVHPRQMEYLMQVRPPSFSIDSNRVQFGSLAHDHVALEFALESFRGFLARVPAFVWADLRIQPPVFVPAA